MNHQGTVRLETERLIIRKFTMDDAEQMYKNWASDPEVTKFLTWPTHRSVEVTKMVLGSWIDNYDSPDFYNWGIELKATGELVGNISVVKTDDDIDAAEIGYCMGREWWGQGIMPEAGKAVVKFLFDEVNMNRVTALHDVNNPRSGRVMQKIGMKYEGTSRAGARNNQGIVDTACYAILKEDYEKLK